jgi:ankyrin repeat protein
MNASFIWAIKTNNSEAAINMLLNDKNIDVNYMNPTFSSTPLISAIRTNQPKLVKMLLEHEGIDVNLKDSYFHHTPLIWAVKEEEDANQKEIVKMLLEHKDIKVNLKDKHGNTPLIWTMKIQTRVDFFEMLLKHKDIDVNCENNYGDTLFKLACVEILDNKGKFVDMLLKRTAHQIQRGRHNQPYGHVCTNENICKFREGR